MISQIIKNVIFPIGEFIQGTNIKTNLKNLERSQWWSYEQLEKLQIEKLRALMEHSYKNVPYYRDIFNKINLRPQDIKSQEDLSKLPMLTKSIARQNLSGLLARNLSKNQMMETYTSGSTGEPFKYYLDKNAYSELWGAVYRAWRWAGYELGNKYAKISLYPRDEISKKVQDFFLRCKYICAVNITDDALIKHIKSLEQFKPSVIRGYPSMLYLMASNMEYSNIRPKGVITSGEILLPNYKKEIERKFGCKVFDQYGGEGMPIAFQCKEHSGYHIAMENVIVECLKDNEPVREGEMGEIVITNLNNYAMPFIRYKIGDMGVMSDCECSCGRNLPLMKEIRGRDTDIIKTINGRYLTVFFFNLLFQDILGVDQYQIVQNSLDWLVVKIVTNPQFTLSDFELIKNSIQKEAGSDVEINIEYVDTIPLEKSNKRRFVISKLN